MTAAAALAGLLDAEDCLRAIPKELAALGALMRLAAVAVQPLPQVELEGVSELLYLIEIQARQLEEAYDKQLPAARPALA